MAFQSDYHIKERNRRLDFFWKRHSSGGYGSFRESFTFRTDRVALIIAILALILAIIGLWI